MDARGNFQGACLCDFECARIERTWVRFTRYSALHPPWNAGLRPVVGNLKIITAGLQIQHLKFAKIVGVRESEGI